MGSDLETIREHLEELDRQLGEVRQRLARLEAREDRAELAAVPAADAGYGPPSPATARTGPALSSSAVALAGRTLVVLGGAYLFRAVTERAWVAPWAGAGAALLYAVFWLWRCERSAARGDRASALFHGLTGTVIAYSLVWETASVFAFFPPAAASAVGVGLLALALGVATAHRLTALAWTAVVAHVAVAFALMFGTHVFLPTSLALVAGAAAVQVPRVAERWPALRWPAALAADAGAAALVGAVVARAGSAAAEPVGALGAPAVLVLPAVYVVSVADRTLRRGRPVRSFEVLQLALALVVGLAGGVRLEVLRGASAAPIGALAALLGAAGYAAAFAFVDRRQGRGANFYAFTTFGALLVLSGSALALGAGSAAVVVTWSALSLAAVGLGVRFDRITLRAHAAVYAWAAAVASGLVAAAGDGLLAAPDAWRPLSATAPVVGAVALAGAAVLFATRRADAARTTLLPQVALAALLVVAFAGLAARVLAPVPTGWLAEADAPAALAALRSILLALLALALAVGARRWALPELRWLVIALLVAGAAKLLWEDLPLGEPVALFAALAAYGGALIATSRLLRSGERADTPDEPHGADAGRAGEI